MVGFTLSEMRGNVVDTAEERVEQMQEAFDEAVKAFLDCRFEDARERIDEILDVVDGTEFFLALNGVSPEPDAENPAPGSPECGDRSGI